MASHIPATDVPRSCEAAPSAWRRSPDSIEVEIGGREAPWRSAGSAVPIMRLSLSPLRLERLSTMTQLR